MDRRVQGDVDDRGGAISRGLTGFPTSDRYEALRRVGAGAGGVVYAARDRDTGRQVALKTLHWPEGEQIFKIKQEFRALSGLSHANLVGLHDLHTGPDGVFFTMELVEGDDFCAHVRRGVTQRHPEATDPEPLTPAEYDALRGLIRQLAEGLDAIHAAGRVHRDIKPSNVLVTREGRVVLLDFGLATTIHASPGALDDSSRRRVVGTIAYMAPEQGWAEEVGPAADWYAAGVMLFEALTGVKPFEGALMEVLHAKEAGERTSPRQLVPDTPADLNALVMRLLEPQPSARPVAAEVLQAIGVSTAGLRSPLGPPPGGVPAMVGRRDALGRLHQWAAAVRPGQPTILHLTGESGVGKTALLERFITEAAPASADAIATRCHLREDVPFKALDGIVDGISRRLVALPPARVRDLAKALPPDLIRLFPVLSAVPHLPWPQGATDGDADRAAQVRGRAIEGLQQILTALAGGRPFILWIDDAHWGDLDSAHALHALLRGPKAPPALVVLSYPSAEADATTPQRLRAGAEGLAGVTVATLELPPLPPAEAAALARSLLADQAERHTAQVVREAEGSPLVVAELSLALRAWPDLQDLRLETILQRRVATLSAGARRLLHAVCVAGRPLPRDVAGLAALLSDADGPIDALIAERLVRPTRDGHLEPYHSRVRPAVLGGLDEAASRALHERLARAMESIGAGGVERVTHMVRAGQTFEAAELATRAGRQARHSLAFHLAAALFARALRLLPSDHAGRWELADHLAESLACAGRSAEAGRAWSDAARLLEEQAPEHPRLPDLHRLAAEEHLRGGQLDVGFAELGRVLEPAGLRLPTTPQAALRRLIVDRLRVRLRGLRFTLAPTEELDPTRLRQVDACWTAAMGLCWVDSMRSAAFQCRYMLLALPTGEPDRVSRALATEAAFAANEGGAGNRRRSAAALDTARQVVAEVDAPVTRAIVEICASAAAFFSARFTDAVRAAERGEAWLETADEGWTWEALNCHVFGMWSRAYLGELSVLRERLPRLIEAARDRGDVLTAASLSSGVLGLAWLAEDRPEDARQKADDAMALWVHSQGFHTQHYMNLVARVQLDLYDGNGARALERVEAAWPRMRQALMLRLQYIRMEATWIRGRALLGALAATQPEAQRARLRRRVLQDARTLRREDLPWGAALAAGLRAGAATATAERVARLREAVEAYDDVGMALCREAARLRLGQWLDAASGAPHIETATRWLDGRGVRDPNRLVEVVLPGCAPPSTDATGDPR